MHARQLTILPSTSSASSNSSASTPTIPHCTFSHATHCRQKIPWWSLIIRQQCLMSQSTARQGINAAAHVTFTVIIFLKVIFLGVRLIHWFLLAFQPAFILIAETLGLSACGCLQRTSHESRTPDCRTGCSATQSNSQVCSCNAQPHVYDMQVFEGTHCVELKLCFRLQLKGESLFTLTELVSLALPVDSGAGVAIVFALDEYKHI